MNESTGRDLDLRLTDAERTLGSVVREAAAGADIRSAFVEELGGQLKQSMGEPVRGASLARLFRGHRMRPVRAGLAAAAAIAIVLGVGVLAPRLTPQVDATE